MGGERRQKILFGILGVLVVIFIGRMVLAGGGDGDESGSSTTNTTRPDAAALVPSGAGDATTPTTVFVPAPEEDFSVFAGRNPFEPVIGGGFPSGDDGDADSDDDSSPPDSEPQTDFPPDTSFPPFDPGVTVPSDGATDSTAVGTFDPTRRTVTLLDVYDDNGAYRASVQVDASVYDVGVNETFAGSYSVVSLDATCGQFLYGDSSFQLCEGEQIIK
ncbi:MAG: hypothetical protein ACT4OX_12240 [Actinomycetota bacterium]